MIYLTAHHVRSRGGEPFGINGAAHRNAGVEPPSSLTAGDVSIGTDVGPTVATCTNVPPGGNFVDAYLDVVAPDERSATEIRGALQEFSGRIPTHAGEDRLWSEAGSYQGNITVRYYWTARTPLSPRELFDALQQVALDLYDRAQEPSTPQLVIERSRAAGKRTFRLADACLEIVRRHRSDLDFVPVTIRDEVYEAYESLRGTFEEEVPALLLIDSSLADHFGDVLFREASGT